MTSFRKKKHIIESNLRLEKRYLIEKNELEITSTSPSSEEKKLEQTKEEQLVVFSDLIETIKKEHPERARACRKLYDSVQYGEVDNVRRFADKCLEALPNKERTDYTSKMLLFSKQQSDLLKSGTQKTTGEKIRIGTEIATGVLILWNSIKQAFQSEEQR
jgi:hypothetical protein